MSDLVRQGVCERSMVATFDEDVPGVRVGGPGGISEGGVTACCREVDSNMEMNGVSANNWGQKRDRTESRRQKDKKASGRKAQGSIAVV